MKETLFILDLLLYLIVAIFIIINLIITAKGTEIKKNISIKKRYFVLGWIFIVFQLLSYYEGLKWNNILLRIEQIQMDRYSGSSLSNIIFACIGTFLGNNLFAIIGFILICKDYKTILLKNKLNNNKGDL